MKKEKMEVEEQQTIDEQTADGEANTVEVDEYEQKLRFLNPIASPLANKKLTKRVFKCIKKGI
jgi:hypothetical protein